MSRGRASVVALEHLVHEDPEALVDRRLLRHPQHARELVAQRARAVGLDVRRRQHEPRAAARQERDQRRLRARGARGGAGAVVALGVEQQLVERRGLQHLALHRRDRRRQALVDRRERLGDRLARRALEQRRELDELEVAHDGVRDVEVGVQAQLAQALARPSAAPASSSSRSAWNVACSASAGPEQLLLELLPLARRPRRAPPRRTATAAAARRSPRAPGRRARGPCRRASSPCAAAGASTRRAPRGRRGRAPRAAARRGSARPRASARPASAPTPARGRRRGRARARAAASSAMTCTAPARGRRGVLVAQLGLRDGRDVAREVARRRVRRAARVGARELAEAREVHEPLDDVGLRAEDLLAAQARAARSGGAGRGRGGRSPASPPTRGRAAGTTWMRSRASYSSCGDSVAATQRRHHVELAPARDLHAAREVDGAQRRPAGGRARARPRRRRWGRRAGAARRARRGPRRARRSPPRRPSGSRSRAPRRRPRRRGPRRAASARARRCARARSRRARAARPRPPRPAPARARRPRARSARVPPGSPPTGVPSRSAIGSTTARAASSTRCGQRSERSRRTTSASGWARSKSRTFLRRRGAQAPRGLVVVGGGGQAAVLGGEQLDEQRRARSRGRRARRRARGGSARRPARGRAGARAASRSRAGRARRRRARPPRASSRSWSR